MSSEADIDYIIMTNAHEESRFAELLADFRQSFSDVSEVSAKQLLRARLVELLIEARIGFYAIDHDASGDHRQLERDLTTAEAMKLIGDDRAWAWTPSEDSALYFLVAIDQGYWGRSVDRGTADQ